MENESFGQRAKRKTKSFIKRALIVIVVVGILILSFLYFATYDDGVMAGKVLRISKKGVMFKTYEGKLNVETFGSLKGASPIAESYDFSVEGHQDAVIKLLEEVALSGERVNLHYIKRYTKFPWRGETNTFVTQVERLKQ